MGTFHVMFKIIQVDVTNVGVDIFLRGLYHFIIVPLAKLRSLFATVH